MTSGTGRWLAPLGASAAVLVLFVVPGVLAGIGGSDAGPGPDRLPGGVVTPNDLVTPSVPPDGPDGPGEDLAGPRGVDVIGYRAEGRTLEVFYTVDQSTDCSGRIEEPVVEERVGSVLIRLKRRPSQAPDEVCVNLLLTSSVEIRLSRPIGERVVQDGSRGGALVPIERAFGSKAVVPTPTNGRAGR